jgi:hypothetical protein
MGVIVAMKTNVPEGNVPVDKQRSRSLMMALGMMLASGARADARDTRERLRRQLERAENAAKTEHSIP